ncbi:MAG: J domain-containing protein [Synergistetes bacterium HGW-Synergistetes-2]|jgi:DnaJ like chaperone protein|nr:MAG: J domain-containing protein [Synergistetes bacterium HGW-Synergistetes-2]
MFLFRLLLKAAPLLLFFLFSKILKDMLRGAQSSSGPSGGARGRSSSGGGSAYTPPPGGKRDPYTVLGCSPSSSNEEIKKRYRELLAKYHPDKFIGQNLDEDFVALASRKFQEIQEAYGRIRSARGI